MAFMVRQLRSLKHHNSSFRDESAILTESLHINIRIRIRNGSISEIDPRHDAENLKFLRLQYKTLMSAKLVKFQVN